MIVVTAAIAPIAYLILVSISPNASVSSSDIWTAARDWSKYTELLIDSNLPRAVLNSLIVAIAGAILGLAIGFPAAWAIVRHARGSRYETLIVSVSLFPPVVGIVPLFLMFRQIGLTNDLLGLVILYAFGNVPIAVWLLAGYLRRLPQELDEAAQVDGAGTFRTLFSIILPVSIPYLTVVGIISAIFNYQEFLLALFLAPGQPTQTAPVMINVLQGDRIQDLPRIAAASVITIVPLFLSATFLQRWIIGGLTAGTVR